jgi:hypothetical protein
MNPTGGSVFDPDFGQTVPKVSRAEAESVDVDIDPTTGLLSVRQENQPS